MWHCCLTAVVCDAQRDACVSADGEHAKSSSELTSPSQQTDEDTSPLSSSEPASDETVVDKPDEETPHKAETDKQDIDGDTRTLDTPR